MKSALGLHCKCCFQPIVGNAYVQGRYCETCYNNALQTTTAGERGDVRHARGSVVAGLQFLRGRSVADQETHSLPVGGSIPSPATNVGDNLTAASPKAPGWRTRNLWPRVRQFFRSKRNRRGHRLGRLLALSHPHWLA